VDAGTADLLSIITGVGGVAAAAGGIMLTVRAVRSKERRAANDEITQLSGMLDEERKARLTAEQKAYARSIRLAQNGLDPDGDA
jgi:hypothetical protein